jgi:hypothetical protein
MVKSMIDKRFISIQFELITILIYVMISFFLLGIMVGNKLKKDQEPIAKKKIRDG